MHVQPTVALLGAYHLQGKSSQAGLHATAVWIACHKFTVDMLASFILHVLQEDERELAATEQVKQLQAQLKMQAKSYQLVQEAFAIEEKCKRDELQVVFATGLLCQLLCTPSFA